jgi:hypothetical protein
MFPRLQIILVTDKQISEIIILLGIELPIMHSISHKNLRSVLIIESQRLIFAIQILP